MLSRGIISGLLTSVYVTINLNFKSIFSCGKQTFRGWLSQCLTFPKIALSCLCRRHLMFNGTDIKGNLWHRSKNCWKTLRSVSEAPEKITRKLSQRVRCYRNGNQFLSGCNALFYILLKRVDICWPCTVQLLHVQRTYSHSERSNLIIQEWHVKQDRIWSSLSF